MEDDHDDNAKWSRSDAQNFKVKDNEGRYGQWFLD